MKSLVLDISIPFSSGSVERMFFFRMTLKLRFLNKLDYFFHSRYTVPYTIIDFFTRYRCNIGKYTKNTMRNFQCRSQFTDWRYTVVTIKCDSLYTKSRFQYDRSLLITRRIEKNVRRRKIKFDSRFTPSG